MDGQGALEYSDDFGEVADNGQADARSVGSKDRCCPPEGNVPAIACPSR